MNVVYFYPILGARKGARYPKSGKNIQQIGTFLNFFMKKGYNFLKKGIRRVEVTLRRVIFQKTRKKLGFSESYPILGAIQN